MLSEEVEWPAQIGGTAEPLPRWEPLPHQRTAIEAVVNGFRDHDRGRLVMACGTGKTLTAMWIAERLQSSLSLVLVPSLSLVKQNLDEWGRHSGQDFDTLVVCSDESVSQRDLDPAIQSTADLGVKVTTDPADIRHFLAQRRPRPAVVFATYHSSDRIAAAQSGKTKPFDLVICDEAHRLAGHVEGLFTNKSRRAGGRQPPDISHLQFARGLTAAGSPRSKDTRCRTICLISPAAWLSSPARRRAWAEPCRWRWLNTEPT